MKKAASNEAETRISLINTHWTEIFEAHNPDNDASLISSAQQNVIRRYSGCIYRYLFGATGSYDLADELAQEFAFRFVRGDFRNADPAKGRFRDYLLRSLRNLVNDHYRSSQRKRTVQLVTAMVQDDPSGDYEGEFADLWRQELLKCAWRALENFENTGSNHYYTVLRCRAEFPDLNSNQLAEVLSERLSRQVTPAWTRQNLRRSRKKFASLLIEEVKGTVSKEIELDAELADLRLLEYIQL